MNRIQSMSNTNLNHNKQHYRPLTELEKLHNRIEANSTFIQIVLEEIAKRGGLTNASN